MSLDTLSIARELRDADVAPAQAEAIASAIGRAVSEGGATKGDIALVQSEIAQLRSEMAAQESRLEAKLEAVQTKLIMWLVSSQIALAAVIIAALKL